MRNLPLLLQILAALFIAIALVNILIAARGADVGDSVIVMLDTSASMQTTMAEADGNRGVTRGGERGGQRGGQRGGERLEVAKQRAWDYIQTIPDNTRIMVVAAGATPAIVSSFTRDRLIIREDLFNINATDEPGNMENALLNASGFGESDRDVRIALFSDGAFDIKNKDLITALPLDYFQVGTDEKNVAISGFELRKPLSRRYEYEIMISLINYHSENYSGALEISTETGSLISETIGLGPFERRTIIFPYDGLLAGRIRADIKPGDAFEPDDMAVAILVPEGAVKVRFVSPGDFFLEQLLATHPNIELSPDNSAAITIYDREYPEPNTTGNYVLIGAVDDSLGIRSEGIAENPAVTGWSVNHPVLKHVDLSELSVFRSIKVRKDDGAISSVVHSGDNTLIYTIGNTDRTVVGFTFAISASNLPLRAAFPILFNNVLSWLAPSVADDETAQTSTGGTYTTRVAAGVDSVSITDPAGTTWTEPANDGYVTVRNLQYIGFYTITTPAGSRQFAANLLNKSESNITPRFIPSDLGSSTGGISQGAVQKSKNYYSVWLILIAISIGLLISEWLIWMRRQI